jgi:hypothetical protein
LGLETKLRDLFLEVVDDDRLLELPFSVIDRVLVAPSADDRVNFDRVFRFCIKALNRFGSPASILVGKLNKRGLTSEDWFLLKSQQNFI